MIMTDTNQVTKENLEIGREYFFVNIYLPEALPKPVTLIDLRGNVARFDGFVGRQEYADARAIGESLFLSYNEAIRGLVNILKKGEMNFIDDTVHKLLKEKYPEMYL